MTALVLCVFSALLLSLQGPGNGWTLVNAQPREVKSLYWELQQTTEVWLRLIPENKDGKPSLVNLVFQAFFPGRAERNPYTGLPTQPKGPPAQLVVTAAPLPTTVIRELSLRLVIDGKPLDLTGPASKYRNLPCLVASDDCVPNAVQAELTPAILHSLINAGAIEGQALGFPIMLMPADQRALAEFATRIGVPR